MKLPGWAFGAFTGVLAVALGALIEGIFVHPWGPVRGWSKTYAKRVA